MHKYGILLESSNHSYIVNNTGVFNDYNIIESNCENNYFKDNFLQDPQENEINDLSPIIIDSTIIILICIFLAIIPIFLKELRTRTTSDK